MTKRLQQHDCDNLVQLNALGRLLIVLFIKQVAKIIVRCSFTLMLLAVTQTKKAFTLHFYITVTNAEMWMLKLHDMVALDAYRFVRGCLLGRGRLIMRVEGV